MNSNDMNPNLMNPTQHLSEEQLALHYYGDSGDVAQVEVERHLAACAACRGEFEQLKTLLGAVRIDVPEPAAGFEAATWGHVRSRLAERDFAESQASVTVKSSWLQRWFGQPWAVGGALALVIVGAFVMGRWFERGQGNSGGTNLAAGAGSANVQTVAARNAVRDRILLVAVGDHLERSQMVLVELVNTKPGPSVDISLQQVAARRLLDDNRLYRQTAAQVQDHGTANVLDELERLLVDISHQPSTVNEREFDDIRSRIEAQGILFKVRILETQVRQRERRGAEAAATGTPAPAPQPAVPAGSRSTT